MAPINIDAFVRNAKENPTSFGPKVTELSLKAKEQNVSPCSICTIKEYPDLCGSLICFAWYSWFGEKWRGLQKAAGVNTNANKQR
jgi:hypothetical protein